MKDNHIGYTFSKNPDPLNGRLPDHWNLRRLKFCVQLIDDKFDGTALDIPYVGLENIEPWSGRITETENSSAEGIANRFQAGDVLFGKLRPYLAKVALVDFEGECTGEALVLRHLDFINPRYLRYCLVRKDFINKVNSSTYGAKMPRANWNFIGSLSIPIPSLLEQDLISNFLDTKTSHIDSLIAKKRKLLELLAKKRTALITKAVTKGFGSDVSLKESGFDWLGKVPEHWEIRRLKFISEHIEQGWSPQCEGSAAEGDEWGVLKVGCVNGETFNPQENKKLPADLDPRTRYKINEGDILISRANTRELLGSAAIVPSISSNLLLCDKLYRLRPVKDVNKQYLVHYLRSSAARFQYEREATGTSGSMQNIGQDTIKNLIVPLPPPYEQTEIVEVISKEAAKLAVIEETTHRMIERLLEYRSALITAAVTGKIDVSARVSQPEELEA